MNEPHCLLLFLWPESSVVFTIHSASSHVTDHPVPCAADDNLRKCKDQFDIGEGLE